MKRSHQKGAYKAERTGNIKKDLSQKQLAGIGAVAVAYNEVEQQIDLLFFIATDLSAGSLPCRRHNELRAGRPVYAVRSRGLSVYAENGNEEDR